MKESYAELLARQLKNVDYCSGVPDFRHMKTCCKSHDDDYANQTGKWKSDWLFVKCGWTRANEYSTGKKIWAKTVAVGYYVGVTLFGWLPYYNAGKKNNA